MAEYGWNIDEINMEIRRINKLLENDNLSDEERETYEKNIDAYSSLLISILFSKGEIVREDNKNVLNALRTCDEEIKIDNESYANIIKPFTNLGILPKFPIRKKINIDEAIQIVGEAIHDIFGNEEYNTYKKYIVNNPHNIQLGNPGSVAYSMYLKELNKEKVFIHLPNEGNIKLIGLLGHETGHINRMVSNDFKIYQDNILREFEAYSYEIRILDYCLKNGIYKQEVLAYFIYLFKILESLATLISINRKTHLHKKETMNELTKIANKYDIYRRCYIPNNSELLANLGYIISEYVEPYFYSLAAVFDTLETDVNLDIYKDVITYIGAMDEFDLADKCFNDPLKFNELAEYKKYRKKVLTEISKFR